MRHCESENKSKEKKSASFNGGNLFYGNDSKSKSKSLIKEIDIEANI